MSIIDDINVECCQHGFCAALIYQILIDCILSFSKLKLHVDSCNQQYLKMLQKTNMINYSSHQINKWLKLKSYQCFFFSQQDSVTI